VREIVINLLQGLKRKQARYRARSHDSEDDYKNKEIPPVPAKERRRDSPARRPVGARNESVKRKETSQPPEDRLSGTNVPVIKNEIPIPSPVKPSESDHSTNEALQKLQTSDALQRRASKRYSAYNFAKLDGFDEAGSKNAPPVPTRRSGSYSPEMTRSPQLDRISRRKDRSPERRPVHSPLPEEDESSPFLLLLT
jgi:hypothetical protein